MARRIYESEPSTFLSLEARFPSLNRNLLSQTAAAEGWKKFEGSDATLAKGAQELAAKVLVAGLRKPPRPAKPSARRRKPGGPPAPRNGRKGRSKYGLGLKDAAPLTDEQNRVAAAREEWETSPSRPSLNTIAQRYGFSSGRLHYIATKVQHWHREVFDPPPPPEPPPPPPPDAPPEPNFPPSTRPGGLKLVAGTDVRTSDVVDFPKSPDKPPKKAVASELILPPLESKARDQLRVTLAAIRAQMSVEQVAQLERHEELLLRYSHLMEVYLEPHRYVERGELTADQYAEKVVATQRMAVRMLLPSERDTLQGAIKTLTDALKTTIELKRTVAGLGKVSAAAFGHGGKAVIDPDAPDAETKGPELVDINAMDTEQLRAVQHAMETLDRHHRKRSDPPKPPPPASIDDLLGPEPVVVQEPDDPQPPR